MEADAALTQAIATLYRAAHDAFVAERKRLAAELKTAGDRAAAAELAKLPRPTLSAWAVNQLWWQAREDFDALFESAERLRRGELDATRDHREAVASLRARAAELLSAGGHAVNDAVLRRVTGTLSALAASGSFDPDPAGALAVDRDPPGFDVVGLSIPAVPRQAVSAAPARESADAGAAAQRLREAVEERERLERERTREAALRAERQRIESALHAAKTEAQNLTLEVARAREALITVERKLQRARATESELEARLAKLEPKS